MHQLLYEIETLSPVLLTQISGDMNMVSTLDYIPGTVVQGVFANKYIKAKNPQSEAHEDSIFYDWFLNSGLIFTNAYITDGEGDNQKAYFFPTPFSIHEYKIAESESKKKKAFDLMAEDPDEEQKRYIDAYCRINDGKIFTKKVKKSINFHHARENRLRGHSEEGTIFNYESMDSGQTFAGRILGSETDLEQIKKLFGKQGKIRIGRSKNTQYGEAKLTWISSEPEKYEYEVQGFVPDELSSNFTLTFLSPAIIYNKCGFASASISDLRKYLFEYLKLDALNLIPESIVISKSFKRTEIIENFVGKWLLKKPSENSIKAGSCFKIEFIVTPDQFENSVKKSILEIQKTGIGERIGEGFGRFAIDLQKEKVYELHKLDDSKKNGDGQEEKEKPKGDIPHLTKEIIEKVILNSYYTLIEAKALSDCSGFLAYKDRIPSNSVIEKIELMMRDSNSSESFIQKIEALPDLTKKKLEKCRSEKIKEKMFDFLITNPIDPKSEENDLKSKDDDPESEKCKIFANLIFDENSKQAVKELEKVCSLISCYPNKNANSKFKPYSHYWLTFLAKMRKEKKKSTVIRERGEN